VLNLNESHKVLDTYHEKFMDDGFPETLCMRTFEGFDTGRFDELELERGRQIWRGRALDEYRSQVGLTEFLSEITELGLPFGALGSGARVVRDEVRHVELCRRMLTVLGAGKVVPGEPNWVRSDKRLPLRLRVLRTVVGSLCVGETLSVRMLNAARECTEEPLAKAAMTCLVSDESFHARFGWSLMEMLHPVLTDEERQDLVFTLPFYLGAVEQMMVNVPDPCQPHPFGFLDRSGALEVFNQYVTLDCIDRFEDLGYPAREAWQKRHNPS
jgi:hypothetical protein